MDNFITKLFSKKEDVFTFPTHQQANRTKEHCINKGLNYSLATYEDFIVEYTKLLLIGGWKREYKFSKSHFTDNLDFTQIHANIILFEGVGMILKTERDYEKYLIWEKENTLGENPESRLIQKW